MSAVAKKPLPSDSGRGLWIQLPKGVTCPLQISKWGNYAEVKIIGQQGYILEKQGRRGKISGMSMKSRLRLIAALHKVPVTLRWLTTLTYSPDTAIYQRMECVMKQKPQGGQKWPQAAILAASQTLKDAKNHLDLLLRWLRSNDIPCAWFMEFTKRGIPHFHLVSETWFSAPTKSVFRKGRLTRVCEYSGRHADFVNRWCVISGQPVSAFQRGGITEMLRTADASVRYAAKEASKRIQKEILPGVDTGRMWGIPRQWRRPPDEVIVIESGLFPRFRRIFAFCGTDSHQGNDKLDAPAADKL